MDPVIGFFNLHVLEELEEEVLRRNMRREMRILRDTSNPFLIPDKTFIGLYRFPKVLVMEILIPQISNNIHGGQRSTKIPIHIKAFVTLYFLAHGGYQKTVGNDNQLAVAQSTVSKIISEVVFIIGTILLPQYIKFPTTAQARNNVKAGFLENFQFPGVIGAIDCTHVAIIAPPHNGHLYYNRKGYHSINVQAICDSDLNILAVNARFPGSTHDSTIWTTSTINRLLRRNFEAGDHATWLLGDSGYALVPWLMTPIPDAPADTPEGRYTAKHCRTRNCIERLFGVLKGRFRCLSRHRVLNYSHEKAALIIYACMVLHNICRTHHVEFDEPNVEENHDNNEMIHIRPEGNENFLATGRHTRARLIRHLDM